MKSKLNQEALDALLQKTLKHGEDIDSMRILMWAVIIVLFVGFAAGFVTLGGLVMQYMAEKQSSFQGLRDKVNDQNIRMDDITQRLEKFKSVKLNCRYEKNGMTCNAE